NGWWRDTAQKLIVLRGDKSVVSALQELCRTGKNPLGRLHALWTLEGLDAIEPAFLAEKLKDADGRVRSAAVRIAEPLIAKGDKATIAALTPIAGDPDPNVVIQYCMSELHEKVPGASDLCKAAIALNLKHPAVAEVVTAYQNAVNKALLEQALGQQLMRKDPKLAATWLKGRELFQQTCIVCHGPDGNGTPVPGVVGVTLAPPLRGSHRLMGNKEITLRVILHGLVGPNEGNKLYPGEMVGFKWAEDAWLASVITYVRNDFGNHAPAITADDLKHVRAETTDRNKPFTLAELKAMNLPEEKPVKPKKK
ncbi:MAG TPA: c-type cytochrome, partial [Humisphaera sp.]|nr:c-type cytochrome [Humisphaera sp.]